MKFRRSLLALAPALAGVLTLSTQVALAAPGDLTSTTVTAPASVSGATLRSSFSDGTGNTYQVYASGQTVTMIRMTAAGAADATFNSGTPVSLGMPTALQTSGAFRVNGFTNPTTSNWWTWVSPSDLNSFATMGVTLTSGTKTGTVSFTKNITGASIVASCAEFLTGSTNFQSPNLLPRRDGGAWLSFNCISPTSINSIFVLVPLTATGDVDATSKTISSSAQHGSTAACVLFPNVIADPTSKAPAPELWVLRTEHNFQTSGRCETFVQTSTASSFASNFVALSSLAVTSNGTVTRTVIPTTKAVQPGGSRIDPGGRVVFLTNEIADTTKVSMSRLAANGSLDNTVGTAGFLSIDIGALPTGATAASTTLSGLVTTNDRVYFVVQIYDREISQYINSSTTPRAHGYRMGLVSPTTGWEPKYGTAGIGGRALTTLPENWFTTGKVIATGSTVNAKGEPMLYVFEENATKLYTWAAITGATGGGEGGTGTGGFTRDTGGAPSLGSGAATTAPKGTTSDATGTKTGSKDARVYTALPSGVRVNKAFTLLSAVGAKSMTLTSQTRSVCVVSARHVVMIDSGRCRVSVTDTSTGAVVRTLSTLVGTSGSTLGSDVTVGGPIRFAQASATLSRTARSQLVTVANNAKGAAAVVVVGHAAELTDSSFNFAISRNRAVAVARELRRAKVTAPITTVSRGTIEQISTDKTEAAQAKNRRVVAYIIP